MTRQSRRRSAWNEFCLGMGEGIVWGFAIGMFILAVAAIVQAL